MRAVRAACKYGVSEVPLVYLRTRNCSRVSLVSTSEMFMFQQRNKEICAKIYNVNISVIILTHLRLHTIIYLSYIVNCIE